MSTLWSGLPRLARPGFLGICNLLFLTLMLGPILWLIALSIFPLGDLANVPPRLRPSQATLSNFDTLFAVYPDYWTAVKNSAVIALSTTGLALIIGSMAAYALARLKFRYGNHFLLTIMLINMLPGVSIIIPFFALWRTVDWLGTYQSIIFTYLVFFLPTIIWILRNFFLSIPMQLEHAARLDGCTRLQALYRVIWPLTTPGLVTAALIAFIGAWNEFFFALVLGQGRLVTLPVRTALFKTETGTQIPVGAAAGIVASVPVILLAILFQRYLIKGVMEGSLKR